MEDNNEIVDLTKDYAPSNNIDSEFKDAAPHKNSLIIIICIMILIVLGFIVGVKLLYLDNPARIFKSSLNEFKIFVENNTSKFKLSNGNKTDVEIETMGLLFDTVGLNDLNKYTLNVTSISNTKENENHVNILFKDGNFDKNVKFEMSYLNDTLYYDFKDAYEKIIELKLNSEEKKEVDTLFKKVDEKNTERINYLTNKLITLLTENVNKDNFSKSKKNINVNNENIKVSDFIYTLKSDELNKTINSVIKGLSNDETSITYLAVLLDLDTVEVNNFLKSLSEMIKIKDGTYKIHVYTKGFTNKLIGFSYDGKSKDIIYYYKNDNSIELGIKDDLRVSGSLEAGKSIILYNGKEKVLELKIKLLNEKEVDFDYEVLKTNIEETISGNFNNTIEENNTTLTFTLNRVVEGLTSTLNLKVNNEAADKFEIKVNKNNLEDARSVEYDAVMNKVMDYYKELPIMKLFENQTVVSKRNKFLEDAKYIMDEAEKQWISDKSNSKQKEYYDSVKNKLNLKDEYLHIHYSVGFDKMGNIIFIIIDNGELRTNSAFLDNKRDIRTEDILSSCNALNCN